MTMKIAVMHYGAINQSINLNLFALTLAQNKKVQL